MTTRDFVVLIATAAKGLLMLSLFSVLVWWKVSAGFFLAGCLAYGTLWLLDGRLPAWIVPVKE